MAAHGDGITMTEDMIGDMMIVTITADHTGEAVFVVLNYLNFVLHMCAKIFVLILILESPYTSTKMAGQYKSGWSDKRNTLWCLT